MTKSCASWERAAPVSQSSIAAAQLYVPKPEAQRVSWHHYEAVNEADIIDNNNPPCRVVYKREINGRD